MDTFGGNKATYIGMEIEKVDTPDFKAVISDSSNYEDKINRIEIPQARSKQKDDFLTEEEQSVMRSELGKLMWLARIARPGAIYDAPAAARNFANSKPGNCDGEISNEENEEGNANENNPKPSDFAHIPGFRNFIASKSKDANKVNLLKKQKKADTSKTHFTVANLIFFEESNSEIKRGREVSDKVSQCGLGRRGHRNRSSLRCWSNFDKNR